jgi:hypothetical protein
MGQIMKEGRPTKYNESFCNSLQDYIKTTGREQTSLPTVEGFAIYLGVSRDTIYEWAKQHKEFSDTVRELMTIQAKQLVDDGIYGGKEINASIVKLLLQANHGMRERTDVTSDDKQLPTPIYSSLSTKKNE